MAERAKQLTANLPPSRYLLPQWPAPANVCAVSTMRDLALPETSPLQGFNLARHVNDEAAQVTANRQQLRHDLQLENEPGWLQQVHGTQVEELPVQGLQNADASTTNLPQQACVIMTADCLPVLFC